MVESAELAAMSNNTMKPRNFATVAAASAVFLAISFSPPASGNDLDEINKLVKQGQDDKALEQVDAYLAQKPKDAQGRFLKGLILTDQNKIADAIKVFTALSEDYPELPEPYNNLAVLYAQQGQYDKARSALETAIQTHPSYATAHENLGDIYARMASEAYDKALQLDHSNATAGTKLALIKELFTVSPKPSGAKPEAGGKSPAPKTEAQIPSPETAKPVARSNGEANSVLKAVNDWAKAWSEKDVDGYLAAYAMDFKTPNGENRDTWESLRRERISKPKLIEVAVIAPKVSFPEPGRVRVSFKQIYHSDSLKTKSSKTLILVKSGGKWLIQQEQVGG